MRVPGFRDRKPGSMRFMMLGDRVQGDYRCLAKIGVEEIADDERGAVGDAGIARVLPGPCDECGIDLDADATCAVFLGGDDRDAAVARPEVVDDIGGADGREL